MIDQLLKNIEYVPPTMLKKILKGIIWEGTPDSGVCALTFDDGPDPIVTPAVLDVLGESGSRGTFFMLGENVRKYPDIALSVAKRGHIIGNHSMTHRTMFLMNSHEVEQEIDQAQLLIHEVTGITPQWFRPPYGMFGLSCVKVVKKRKMNLVLWTALSGDYANPAPLEMIERVKPFIRPGAILVFHDTSRDKSSDLPKVLRIISDIAEEKDIRLGGIDELSLSFEIGIEKSYDSETPRNYPE